MSTSNWVLMWISLDRARQCSRDTYVMVLYVQDSIFAKYCTRIGKCTIDNRYIPLMVEKLFEMIQIKLRKK